MKRAKDPRELAARALCAKTGHPENATFEGRPMWQSFLPEVDAVLGAVGFADMRSDIVTLLEQLHRLEHLQDAESIKRISAKHGYSP